MIETGDALAGFGNPTVVMIAALFVVGEGLSRTGVTGWGGQKLLAAARGSKIRLLVVVMVGTAFLSAFISNTGTVATLLPAVVAAAWTALSRRQPLPRGRDLAALTAVISASCYLGAQF